MTRSSDLVMVEREVLEAAHEALSRCYDVNDWPADGTTRQDAALRLLSSALQSVEGGVQGSSADGQQCNEQSGKQLSPALRAYRSLFEPPESDAYDNLTGALYDIKRHIESGKPTDDVCVRTIERVLDQLNAAYTALRSELTKTPSADHDAGNLRGLAEPNHQPHAVRQGWQDIETAPRDGTPFLCFHPDDVFSPITGIDLIWWEPGIGRWTMDGDNKVPFVGEITHWMPLPAPPSPAKTGGAE